MQSLPLMLMGGIAIVMTATRVLQLVQTHVLHVLPFGSLGHFSIRDVCAGVFVSGLFMMYFGAHVLSFSCTSGARALTCAKRVVSVLERSGCYDFCMA